MNKLYKFSIFALLVIAFSHIAFAESKYMNNPQKLKVAAMVVSEYYVDSVNSDKLAEDAIHGMLKELDPHSSYSDPEETKALTEPLDGNFSGIGVQYNIQEDTLYVIQTVAGGPSEKVGILPGDRIITVNDTTIAGVKMTTKDITKRLRGKKGTKVEVGVKRRNVPELIQFRITREDIPLYSVDAAYMIDENTGYVRISRFAETTHDEFMKAVKKLKKQEMKQLIVDLTDNGGGYLNIATKMVNEFLEDNQMIVYTEGRRSPRYEEKANGRGKLKDLDVVVCVNQYSASASEIFSGAIQDWDRGVIVGRRTFGKGLVQRPVPFPDGSMIRLTVARYYTPSGRCIQKPYTKGKDDYEKEILDRYNHGELAHADSIHFNDSLKYTTLHKNRVIYGGGGIMPDYFVPLDTTEYSDYFRDLIAKGTLIQYINKYVEINRKEIKKQYKNIDIYINKYEVDSLMLKDLITLADKDSIKYNEKQFNASKELIKQNMKAIIARDLFEDAAFYMVMNKKNDIVKSALDIINDKNRYNMLLNK